MSATLTKGHENPSPLGGEGKGEGDFRVNNCSSNVKYGKERIPFKVLYADRKTMEIAVHPSNRVVVRAPNGTELNKIKARIMKRARWIRKQLDYFRRFAPRTPSRNYVGGETHFYLGGQYRLKIKKWHENDVKLKGAFFYITTPDTNNRQNVNNLLDEWYKKHACKIFTHRLELCFQNAKRLKKSIPTNTIKKNV